MNTNEYELTCKMQITIEDDWRRPATSFVQDF